MTGTTANTSPQSCLTLEKLHEAVRAIAAFPAPPGIDLYPHHLGDQAYELKLDSAETSAFAPLSKGRRVFVVPKVQIERWAWELRRHGADVRVEPIARQPVSEPAQQEKP